MNTTKSSGLTRMMETEPILTVGMIGNVVMAAIAMLIAFGLPISHEQQQAIVGFASALFVLISVFLPVLRQLVYSPASYAAGVEEAKVEGAEQAGVHI